MAWYRYPRQRRTTIIVKAPRRFLETVLLRQFRELHDDLSLYLEQTTERVIRDAVHMSEATSGIPKQRLSPAYRCAHAGYGL